MRTIALSCNKGGVGKTSISKHIATAAAASGLNVMLLDMDTQQNATNWGRRRSMRGGALGVPVVRFVTENDLPDTLARASAAGCDLVVIDTPPGRSAEAPAAVEASDIVLIPFWLEKDAFDGVQRTAALASRMGKPAFGVLNFATPNSQIHIEAARDSLGEAGGADVASRAASLRGLSDGEPTRPDRAGDGAGEPGGDRDCRSMGLAEHKCNRAQRSRSA